MAGRVVKNGEPLADLNDRWHTDALCRPLTIFAVKDDSFIFRVPLVQVPAPVNPYGVCVFTPVDADVLLLFNLAEDIGETKSVAKQHPKLHKKMFDQTMQLLPILLLKNHVFL